MCGVAPTIGRIIGVDPYWNDGLHPKRKLEEICKHCIYGMPGESKKVRRNNQANLIKRAMQDGPISKTYQEGVKRHRRDPMSFEKADV